MNNEWQRFLVSQSAQIGAEGGVHFPGAPERPPCALVDLSHLGLIEVAGEDAGTFLQGQLTNDVRELSDGHTQLAGYCSAKGRMLASLRMIRLGGSYLMQLPLEKLATVMQRLRLFVLRSKVTLRDASDRLVAIGIAGECAEPLLRQLSPRLPERPNDLLLNGDLALIRMAGPTPRFQLLGPVQEIRAAWQLLCAQAVPVDADLWSLLDIRAGIPSITAETTEAFVPQMANMQLIDGVSFTKGCYTGQEVVARMQYLGKLKRRMYLAEVVSPTPPRPGDELFSTLSDSAQGAGKVVNAAKSGDNRYELLAVIEIDAAEQGEVSLGDKGPTLRLKPLPYPLASDQENTAN